MHLILWFSGLFLHFPLVWWRFDKVLCENPFKLFVWSSRLSPVNVTLKLMSTNIIPGTRFEQTLYHLENTFFYITKNLLIINWCRAMLVNCIWINPGCLVQHLIGSCHNPSPSPSKSKSSPSQVQVKSKSKSKSRVQV